MQVLQAIFTIVVVAAFRQSLFRRNHHGLAALILQPPPVIIEWDNGEVAWFGVNETVDVWQQLNETFRQN